MSTLMCPLTTRKQTGGLGTEMEICGEKFLSVLKLYIRFILIILPKMGSSEDTLKGIGLIFAYLIR